MSSYARTPTTASLRILALLGGLATLCAAVAAGQAVKPAAGVMILVTILVAGWHLLSRWHALVGALGLIILFVPIKRYKFAGVDLPFDLEPYRIAVAVVVSLWLSSLLIDRRVALRRSGLEGPFLLFGIAVVGSIATNPGSIAASGVANNVTKELLFLLSFFLVFYLVVSVVRTPGSIHVVLKTLVAAAAIVALFAIIERRTRYNVFNHLQPLLPLLEFRGELDEAGIKRGSGLRTYASAQHPIALGAMFVMLTPIAFYLFHSTRRAIWAAASVLIVFGALTTISRTSITMLATALIVFLVLQPASVKKLLPLVLPALIVVHLALPGVIGSLRQSFFPPQGLIDQQQVNSGRVSGERLDPQFAIIRGQPAFGQGYGTRQTTGLEKNAEVLDNQWLGTAVETGLVGIFAWAWIFVRFVRRAGRAAKADGSDRGWLLTAFAASAAAFPVGMFTFDAFSFIQATFVLFMLLSLGASALAWRGRWPENRPEPGRGRAPADRIASA